MGWTPNKLKGFSLPYDGEVYGTLLDVIKLLHRLKKSEKHPAEWGETLVEHGAERIDKGKYRNYSWSISTGPSQEVRISYTEYWENKDDDEPKGRVLTFREWFKTRDKGER